MKRCYLMIWQITAVTGALLTAAVASANISIQTVQVGDAGNIADSNGYGTVGYTYNIGKFDVTAGQYASFLNAVAATDTFGLFNPAMAGQTGGNPGISQNGISGAYVYTASPGRENRPVTDVTFSDTLRFANWLANGQPSGPEASGITETGTYTLADTTSASGLLTVHRNAGATWALPSENEWYKAAYYGPALDAAVGGYWKYATQANEISPSEADYQLSGLSDTTDVGSYIHSSYFGTFDQSGDAYQWNEPSSSDTFAASIQGGSFENDDFFLAAVGEYDHDPDMFESWLGFRVVQVPETSYFATISILGAVISIRRRLGVTMMNR